MTDTVTKSMDQFIADARISMTAIRVDRNPHMQDSDQMDHWKLVLSRQYEGTAIYHDRVTALPATRKYTARMTTYFSMGYGHNGTEPKPADVLDCLASDANTIEWGGFIEWCDELGYDYDSRKAEKTYKTIQHQTARLKKFLGGELYDEFSSHVERL